MAMRLLRAEDVEDVAGVALRAVGDEDLVVGDVDAVRAVVVLRDGVRAGTRSPAPGRSRWKVSRVAHLIHGLVHRVAHRRGQRLGHVADAAADHALRRLRICGGESLHAPGDLGKEVAGLELEVVFVEEGHAARCSSAA